MICSCFDTIYALPLVHFMLSLIAICVTMGGPEAVIEEVACKSFFVMMSVTLRTVQ